MLWYCLEMDLYCKCLFLLLQCDSFLAIVDAGLKKGVTDCGLSALASAGCGAQLTSLNLECEWIMFCWLKSEGGVIL